MMSSFSNLLTPMIASSSKKTSGVKPTGQTSIVLDSLIRKKPRESQVPSSR